MSKYPSLPCRLLVLLALSSSRATANVDVGKDLVPHLTEWSQEGDVWTPAGEEPPAGWYLRSRRQYDIDTLAFRVRRDEDRTLVYLHLKDFRIQLRPDRLIVKYTGEWGKGKPPYRYSIFYHYAALRPLRFPSGEWQTFGVTLDGECLRLAQNGKEILSWSSPRDEWQERVRKAGKPQFAEQYVYPERLPESALAGEDQIVVFQSLYGKASVRDVRLVGTDKGEARGFRTGRAEVATVRPDWEVERLAPQQPVDVAWELPAAEKARAAQLPAVEEWSVPKEHRSDSERDGPEVMNYRLGAEEPGELPTHLYPYWRFKGVQTGRVYFNLKNAGDYTLRLAWPHWGMGFGPNVLEISVDGEPVSRELYRGFAQNRSCPPGFDYTPLRLKAGPHRIDFHLDLSHFKRQHFFQKYQAVMLGDVSLVRGVHEPLWTYTAGKPATLSQRPEALADPISHEEVYGKLLRYRIEGLEPDRPHKVTLGWHEIDVNVAGVRLMDVFVNGRQVEDALDIVGEAGWGTDCHRTYEAKAGDVDENGAAIEIRIVGRTFKAFLNYLRIENAAGQTVFEDNCGWHPLMAVRRKRRIDAVKTPHLQAAPTLAEPPKWTPEAVFDGYNLIANPHVSLLDESGGRPAHWRSVKELAALATVEYRQTLLDSFEPDLAAILSKQKILPNYLTFYSILQGDGEVSLDADVGRAHPGSLKVARSGRDFAVCSTSPMVDYHKRQSFRVYVRTQGASGRVMAEVHWFAVNMDADLKYRDRNGPLFTPRLQPLGRSTSTALTGDNDWTALEIHATPPLGTIYAMPVVRVEDNAAGAVWIDDADFMGYGAEPLEICYSRAGYHPMSVKRVIVRSLAKAPVRWRLVNPANGKAVREGEAAHVHHEWFSRRHYYRLDVSDVDEEGTYALEATQAGQVARTEPFVVGRRVYRDVARKMLHALWLKRMNWDIPDGHEADCLEDAYSPHTVQPQRFAIYEKLVFPQQRDLLGGYYDAGDMIKHVEFWPCVLLSLSGMHRNIRPTFHGRTSDDVLDEMMWAFRAFHKFQVDEGSFILSGKPQGYALDNIPCYALDRMPSSPRPLLQAAGAAALAAYELRALDPGLSARYVDVARKNYERNRLWTVAADAEVAWPGRLSAAAKALAAETYLSRLTGDPVYAERMGAHARVVAEGLRRHAYAQLKEMFDSHYPEGGAPQDCVWAPLHFLRLHPTHAAAEDLRNGLRAFVTHVRELSEGSVYGQAGGLNSPPDGPPARFPAGGRHDRSIGYWPMLAHTLAEIGMLLGDAETVRLAERQLQWCLGKNVADLSMVQGVGDRFVAGGDHIYWQAEFFDAWLRSDRKLMYFDGNVPTAAMRDIGTGEVNLSKSDNYEPFCTGYPRGYCAMPATPGYGYHPGPSENYLPQTAQFALAASSICRAMEWLESEAAPAR